MGGMKDGCGVGSGAEGTGEGVPGITKYVGVSPRVLPTA